LIFNPFVIFVSLFNCLFIQLFHRFSTFYIIFLEKHSESINSSDVQLLLHFLSLFYHCQSFSLAFQHFKYFFKKKLEIVSFLFFCNLSIIFYQNMALISPFSLFFDILHDMHDFPDFYPFWYFLSLVLLLAT
jgi:hypothetical protein